MRNNHENEKGSFHEVGFDSIVNIREKVLGVLGIHEVLGVPIFQISRESNFFE